MIRVQGTYPGMSSEASQIPSDDAVEEKTRSVQAEEASEEMAPSTVGGQVLMPMRDMLGYSCFVAWAFLFGWCRSLSSSYGDDVFFISRAFLFGGIFLGAAVLFLTRGDFLRHFKNKPAEWVSPIFCMAAGLTFIMEIPQEVAFGLWCLAGIGQSAMVFFWGMRLRILSRDQQLYAICCGFVIGGSALAIMPFVMHGLAVGVSILLPAVSYGLLRLARQRFEGHSERMTIWKGENRGPKGFLEFRNAIPFKSDRKMVIFRGLFSCLYSIFLGFVTGMVLSGDHGPSEDVVIGLGNIASALIMLPILKDATSGREDMLPRLFLPVTCLCMVMLGTLWPTEWVLLCAFLLFALFGCLEILNAYSAYVGTPYDAVRWFWEIQASKLGNAFGFFVGWLVVVMLGQWLIGSGYVFLLTCFILSIFAVVVDSFLFRRSVFETSAEPMDDDLAEMGSEGGVPGDTTGAAVEEYYLSISQEMAREFKLSPRQTEIFIYLARGRNVQFIREKLVLSTPTVKSHTYAIYQKLGIHSHQELIDMVEQRLKKE